MRIRDVLVLGVAAVLLSAARCGQPEGSCADAADCDDGQLCYEGSCVECVENSDCGADSLCTTYACDAASHTCATPTFVGTDVEVENPTAGDCLVTECDGAGNVLLAQPADDLPADDGNACTVEACPSNTFAGAGTPCDFEGGTSCDATGHCIASFCDEDSDCGSDTFCADVSCDLGTNTCERADLNEGLIVPIDLGNDCVESTCVAGVATPRNDNTETPPQDTNPCTEEICSGGGVSSVPANDGGTCNGGAGVCDNGACGQLTLLSESFDGLPTSGTSTFAAFEAALASGTWQLGSDATVTRAGPGTGSTGAIWSFGSTGTSDRALGGFATPTTATQGWGVCITNASGTTLSTISVAYTGEQWRDGNASPQSLTFSFTTFYNASTLEAQVRTADTGDHTTGWQSVSALSFTSPQLTTAVAALDGNAAENRTTVSGNIPGLTLAAGAVFCVRWIDLDDTGTDHGLAIDNLVIRAQ